MCVSYFVKKKDFSTFQSQAPLDPAKIAGDIQVEGDMFSPHSDLRATPRSEVPGSSRWVQKLMGNVMCNFPINPDDQKVDILLFVSVIYYHGTIGKKKQSRW